MVPKSTKTLRNLRNTRDLRAELLSIAAHLADNAAIALVRVVAPPLARTCTRKIPRA